jgi:hypothetical protein
MHRHFLELARAQHISVADASLGPFLCTIHYRLDRAVDEDPTVSWMVRQGLYLFKGRQAGVCTCSAYRYNQALKRMPCEVRQAARERYAELQTEWDEAFIAFEKATEELAATVKKLHQDVEVLRSPFPARRSAVSSHLFWLPGSHTSAQNLCCRIRKPDDFSYGLPPRDGVSVSAGGGVHPTKVARDGTKVECFTRPTVVGNSMEVGAVRNIPEQHRLCQH